MNPEIRTKHHFKRIQNGETSAIAVICRWVSFDPHRDSDVNFFFGPASQAAYTAAVTELGGAVTRYNSYYLPANETEQAAAARTIETTA